MPLCSSRAAISWVNTAFTRDGVILWCFSPSVSMGAFVVDTWTARGAPKPNYHGVYRALAHALRPGHKHNDCIHHGFVTRAALRRPRELRSRGECKRTINAMIIGFWCTSRGPSDYNRALPTSGSANHRGLGGDRNWNLGGNGPDAALAVC